MTGNEPVVTDKIENEYWDESKLLAHLDSSDNQNAEARSTTIWFLIEYFCKSLTLSIETLQEEIKPYS